MLNLTTLCPNLSHETASTTELWDESYSNRMPSGGKADLKAAWLPACFRFCSHYRNCQRNRALPGIHGWIWAISFQGSGTWPGRRICQPFKWLGQPPDALTRDWRWLACRVDGRTRDFQGEEGLRSLSHVGRAVGSCRRIKAVWNCQMTPDDAPPSHLEKATLARDNWAQIADYYPKGEPLATAWFVVFQPWTIHQQRLPVSGQWTN